MAKFRSWNEKHLKYFYFKDGNYYFFIEFSSNVTKIKRIDFREDSEGFDWDNAEQSTELFDKNDKEIFVGDYLKRIDVIDNKTLITYFNVTSIKELYGNNIKEKDEKCDIKYWSTEFEVIYPHENEISSKAKKIKKSLIQDIFMLD